MTYISSSCSQVIHSVNIIYTYLLDCLKIHLTRQSLNVFCITHVAVSCHTLTRNMHTDVHRYYTNLKLHVLV
jgi:hypothetical protein